MAKTLRIGELAHRFQLNPNTIRYYEDLGLPRPPRAPSGYRSYGEADAVRLDFIAKAKRLGQSLRDIKAILQLCDRGERPCSHVVDLLDNQIAEVDWALAELAAFRVQLASVRDDAAARIPPAALCGIIEHQTMSLAQPPAYLRARGVNRGDTRRSRVSRPTGLPTSRPPSGCSRRRSTSSILNSTGLTLTSTGRCRLIIGRKEQQT